MSARKVFSVCGMCTVRCPIQVDVDSDQVNFIQGNPHSALKGALCARGAAGYALTQDTERPQYPLIREGERGEGKWRKASWDEALDYVAEKLKKISAEHGPESILWSDRGGPFPDLHKALMRGIGSPNYCNHDAACARNVFHAAKSLFGFGRKGVSYDLKNAKHIVLQTRNIFEAINVSEVNQTLDAMDAGAKLTVIDIRGTVSAAKADNFFMVRPGTDYAFNLGVINAIIESGRYDKKYVDKHVKDFDKLAAFVKPYTPEWAAEECGISASALRHFVEQLLEAAPAVIWHPGWMTARYKDSFYVSRTAYIVGALLGAVGAKGGLPITVGPGDVGAKGLKALADLYPKPEAQRADGAGWKLKHIDPGPGLVNKAYEAIETGDPYPIRGYLCFRHDPLMAFPEPEKIKKQWEKLDLLVSITFSWSDTAWHSDVVLPMSPYLERDSIVATKKGAKPQFFVRNRALNPRYDTRSDWEIICGLAEKLGLDKLAFKSLEDLRAYQLEPTGYKPADLDEKGFVVLTDTPHYKSMDDFKFKTPSGKIEMISQTWEEMGFPSLKPYESPERPGEGAFRITFGRCGVHTQGHTVNNPMLAEQMPENVLWINADAAAKIGVKDGEKVVVSSNGHKGEIRAFVTEFIHPECVFMVHGFGHTLKVETRAYGKGVADNLLMPGGMSLEDKAGGGIAMQEHFVKVQKA